MNKYVHGVVGSIGCFLASFVFPQGFGISYFILFILCFFLVFFYSSSVFILTIRHNSFDYFYRCGHYHHKVGWHGHGLVVYERFALAVGSDFS